MVQARFINDTTPVEVHGENEQTTVNVTSQTESKRVEVYSAGDHSNLTGRENDNQHPISAITGLREALDTIPTDYVSDAELDAALLEKQDVIRDLSEIRQGAALGATAVQPNELESYATTQYVDNGLAGKQDTLTAGTGIDITNGVISNTQTSAIWGNITGILSAQTDLQTALNAKANSASLATVATSGSYTDLTNKPTIGNATLTIQKNSTNVDTFTANATVDKIINITVPTTASDVSALPDSTKYGASIDLSLNTTDYKLTMTLKDQDGTTLNSKVVDFPIENVVVNGSYDSTNQKIVLTLQNGNTIDIPVGALIAGLQTEITSTNKLDADLVDDSTSTNKFVTTSDKTTWNGKQDAISDLSTIRTNATNGASAYSTIQNYGDIVTHNASEFATSAQGTLADSALQSGDNISALTNDSGYITSAALSPYVLSSSLSTVATSGDYDDLTDKPTIPTVNNSTITLTQGGTTKGTFTLNQSSNQTIDFDAGGGTPSNMVTTNKDQNITGIKTFVGDKRIKFKQSAASNKLGFTMFNSSNAEVGSFEYNPVVLVNGKPIITLNKYSDSASGHTTYVGFRYSGTAGAYNLLAPLGSDAKTPFNLTSEATNFYLPLGVTDGTTTVTTASTGLLNISSLIPTVDQTYDGTSTHAQSGVAIASVLGDIESAINTIRGV